MISDHHEIKLEFNNKMIPGEIHKCLYIKYYILNNPQLYSQEKLMSIGAEKVFLR